MSPREGRRTRARMLTRFWPPDPVQVADLLQTLKTALAGLVAWIVATDLLHLEQAFLAPFAAVLVVHTTIYRTFSRAGQQVAVTFLGVFLAWLTGRLFGVGALAMGAMLVTAFVVGRVRWWREEGTTLATTGIVVLATNAITQDNLLLSRLVDSFIGVVVGLLVNLVVWPPLRDRAAWSRLDELPFDIAHLLREMATALRPDLEPEDTEPWTREQGRIDERVDEGWRLLWLARESSRFNPRRTTPVGLDNLDGALHLMEQAAADLLSMIRTISTSAATHTAWDEQFRSDWARLVLATAEGAETQDAESLRVVLEEIEEIVARLSTDSLTRSAWHEYGGMLVGLRNVVDVLADVTEWMASGEEGRRRARFSVPVSVPKGRRGAVGRGYARATRGRRPR